MLVIISPRLPGLFCHCYSLNYYFRKDKDRFWEYQIIDEIFAKKITGRKLQKKCNFRPKINYYRAKNVKILRFSPELRLSY